CPNDCVFCDQRAISGTYTFDMSETVKLIEASLLTLKGTGKTAEIAFFGGSFTGIDRDLMISLLGIAESYVGNGVSGIRMSTRPDYIDDEIVEILKKYTVSQIELGIQSMSDAVLSAAKRGHNADDTRRAVEQLRKNGFSVVGQMMVGLPSSSREDEINTAREICALGCDGARIYPTVVFKHTELERMYKRGEYSPLSIDDAMCRSAGVLEIFESCGVECLRVGLCDSENLHSEEKYSAGPVHPAMGELVRGELWRRRITAEINKNGKKGRQTVIAVPRGAASAAAGQKRRNRIEYERLLGARVTIIEDSALNGADFKVYTQEADEVCI
ncbi:MAG: radical SAM protein, partial [Clostridia bacterium]|nr:radical SAM protein [Clostridia bacterium]